MTGDTLHWILLFLQIITIVLLFVLPSRWVRRP